jgi:acetoin utilization deacetylase AcuC-like enzyme
MGKWHPESPHRLDAINDRLLSSGLMDFLVQKQARPATDTDLLRVHAPEYLSWLHENAPVEGYVAIDPDTVMNPHTLDAALAAAGAGITAVDAIMRDGYKHAFCAVRPPGHHARRAQAMGFCFFNNLAVAVAYAMEQYGLERVGIVDFDVHHGNGTEETFANDDRVLMCSFFQHPFFPGVRLDPAPSNMINIPVDPYTKGDALRQIVSDIWMPALVRHDPQFFFISAGFDGLREDEMGQLALVESDYAWITSQIVDLADKTANGRVVSFLEGGYDLSALGRSAEAHVRALAPL